MKWGVKCASAPAPSLCDAPVTSAPVVSRNLLICSKPVAASPLWPTRAPSRNGVALAWRFWPTFSVIFTSFGIRRRHVLGDRVVCGVSGRERRDVGFILDQARRRDDAA